MSEFTARQILIVDDAADNRQILTDLLKPDYTVILAKSGQQALERARSHLPDLILLDVLMADMSGFEVMRQLHADEATAGITVMLITKLDTPDDEVRGLQEGATDYITKPFNFTVVKARVKTQMRLQRQRHQLQTMAHIDALTEIPNRRQFDHVFEAEWSRACRSGLPLSVAMVDVDCFKAYNDSCGHAQGDRVLQSIAGVLTASLRRPGDLAARYGGEEFVLLMPATDAAGALALLESVRSGVHARAIAHPASTAGPWLTVSIGLATLEPGAPQKAGELLALADTRLYQAKNSGRDRVCAA